MDENDYHIFRKIKESGVSNVYVDIYGDENTLANCRAKANARTYFDFQGMSLEFYDAATVSIWS